ncbi:LysR family transcriptional regulator [Enterococcus sp. DIV0086]|uniref:LysR family transcriptional regulator n=1 Tax=Enterococcus sp. DIV0086 TaxID=2774655 RepID=UPI003D296F06
MITTDQLEYFMEICREQNFSRAAENLLISQSSLSKQIKHLEDEVGVILFHRTLKATTLTSEGETFLEYAKKILENYQQMKIEMEQFNWESSCKVTLASIPVLSQYDLIEVLAGFMSKFPQIQVDIIEEESDCIIERMKEGSVDIGIIREETLPDNLTTNYFLAEDELCVVAPITHTLAKAKQLTFFDLKDAPLVLLVPQSGIYRKVFEICNKKGIRLNVKSTNTRIETILSLIKHTETISILMYKSVRPFLTPDVCTIKLSPKQSSRLVLAVPNKCWQLQQIKLISNYILSSSVAKLRKEV